MQVHSRPNPSVRTPARTPSSIARSRRLVGSAIRSTFPQDFPFLAGCSNFDPYRCNYRLRALAQAYFVKKGAAYLQGKCMVRQEVAAILRLAHTHAQQVTGNPRARFCVWKANVRFKESTWAETLFEDITDNLGLLKKHLEAPLRGAFRAARKMVVPQRPVRSTPPRVPMTKAADAATAVATTGSEHRQEQENDTVLVLEPESFVSPSPRPPTPMVRQVSPTTTMEQERRHPLSSFHNGPLLPSLNPQEEADESSSTTTPSTLFHEEEGDPPSLFHIPMDPIILEDHHDNNDAWMDQLLMRESEVWLDAPGDMSSLSGGSDGGSSIEEHY